MLKKKINNLKNQNNKYVATRSGILSFYQKQNILKEKYDKATLLNIDFNILINNLDGIYITTNEFINDIMIFVNGITDYMDITSSISEIEKVMAIALVDIIWYKGMCYSNPKYITDKYLFGFIIDEDSYDMSIILDFLEKIYNKDINVDVRITDMDKEEYDFIRYHLCEYFDDYTL